MKQIDHNQFWLIKDNPITKAGVFPYLGKQISPELEPDKIYQVYRPAEEIRKAADTFKLVPLVDNHTMIGKDFTPAEEKGVHGVLGEEIKEKDGVLYADVKIFSESLKNLIQNGKKELSLGYFCEYDLTPGEYHGVHYDAVQRGLRGNHIALVANGRMGHDVRVMDRALACDAMDIVGNFQTGEKIMLNNDAVWEESKHKRDADGKFSAGGGGGNKKSEAPKKSTPKKLVSIVYKKDPDGHKMGIQQIGSGEFIATTRSSSKTFQTLNGAKKWMASKGYSSADEDLSSKTNGVGGKDAAPEKENEMEKVQQAIEAIKALFADPEAGDKEGKLAEILGALVPAASAGDKCTKDEDVDKRKLIDEIGGILKDKVSDEIIRTIMGKAEELAYNKSEAGSADDEEEPKEESKLADKVNEVEKSMDELPAKVLKMLADREALYNKVAPLVGAFDHADMTEEQVAQYACDKLDIKDVEKGQHAAVLKGYLKAQKPVQIVSMDASLKSEEKDAGFEAFLKGEK